MASLSWLPIVSNGFHLVFIAFQMNSIIILMFAILTKKANYWRKRIPLMNCF